MRIVVKVGTSTLTHRSGNLNIRRMQEFCRVLSDLKNAGNEIILGSSGAIAMGVGKLPITEKPDDIPGKQACAAVGQSELMYVYDKLFGEYNHTVAQLLMTASDFKKEKRHRNFINTMERLLEMGALPVINENDTISVDEIKIGDNDTLGAVVAKCCSADLLIILTDTDGLYTADPREDPNANLIENVEHITPAMIEAAGGSGTERGTGGMATKLKAARIATEAGIKTVIVNGDVPRVLYDVVEDKPFIGTTFQPERLGGK